MSLHTEHMQKHQVLQNKINLYQKNLPLHQFASTMFIRELQLVLLRIMGCV